MTVKSVTGTAAKRQLENVVLWPGNEKKSNPIVISRHGDNFIWFISLDFIGFRFSFPLSWLCFIWPRFHHFFFKWPRFSQWPLGSYSDFRRLFPRIWPIIDQWRWRFLKTKKRNVSYSKNCNYFGENTPPAGPPAPPPHLHITSKSKWKSFRNVAATTAAVRRGKACWNTSFPFQFVNSVYWPRSTT